MYIWISGTGVHFHSKPLPCLWTLASVYGLIGIWDQSCCKMPPRLLQLQGLFSVFLSEIISICKLNVSLQIPEYTRDLHHEVF